jgi:hypothetical protein
MTYTRCGANNPRMRNGRRLMGKGSPCMIAPIGTFNFPEEGAYIQANMGWRGEPVPLCLVHKEHIEGEYKLRLILIESQP